MAHLVTYFEKMKHILPEFNQIQAVAIEDGFSNQVYRLDWSGKPQLILRIPDLDEMSFDVNRQTEMTVLTAAAQSNISPSVLWCDEEGAYATPYVQHEPFGWDVVHDEKSIEQIANLFSRVHQLPAVNHTTSIYHLIDHYLNSVASFLMERPDVIDEYRYLSHLFNSVDQINSGLPSVVCHNDVNPKNILADGQRLWLIDWEYSGMGDPLFDLAVVVRSHNLTREQQLYFIACYDAQLDIDDALNMVTHYSRMYALREMTWLLLKHLTTPSDPDAWPFYVGFKGAPKLNPFL